MFQQLLQIAIHPNFWTLKQFQQKIWNCSHLLRSVLEQLNSELKVATANVNPHQQQQQQRQQRQQQQQQQKQQQPTKGAQ